MIKMIATLTRDIIEESCYKNELSVSCLSKFGIVEPYLPRILVITFALKFENFTMVPCKTLQLQYFLPPLPLLFSSRYEPL